MVTVVYLRILSYFVRNPTNQTYGWDVCKKLCLQSGTVYPILTRMQNSGLLISELETGDPRSKRRPLRIYYAINPKKLSEARQLLDACSVKT